MRKGEMKKGEVNIEIDERYRRNGTFMYYETYMCVMNRKGCGGGMGWSAKNLEEIAKETLFYVAEARLTHPEYKIKLWEGYHPIDKCEKDCRHYNYTKKPEESLREKLIGRLNDEKNIKNAKKRYKDFENTPLEIIIM